MSVSVLVGSEHAGFNEAVLLRMLAQELSIDKETINQWQKGNDKSGDGRSKEEGEKSERQKLGKLSETVFSEPLHNTMWVWAYWAKMQSVQMNKCTNLEYNMGCEAQ